MITGIAILIVILIVAFFAAIVLIPVLFMAAGIGAGIYAAGALGLEALDNLSGGRKNF